MQNIKSTNQINQKPHNLDILKIMIRWKLPLVKGNYSLLVIKKLFPKTILTVIDCYILLNFNQFAVNKQYHNYIKTADCITTDVIEKQNSFWKHNWIL